MRLTRGQFLQRAAAREWRADISELLGLFTFYRLQMGG
jgi:hypothetical protein